MKTAAKIVFVLAVLSGAMVIYQNCGPTNTNSNTSASGSLTITPSTTTVAPGASVQLMATGGTPPYMFYVYSGMGNVNSSTGLFTAATSTGFASVAVRDNSGMLAYASITISSSTGAGGGGGGTYTTSPGNNTVCCPTGTTATSWTDTGTGRNHGIYTNNPSPNCCTAWEGSNNYGSPGCQITCQ